MKKFIPAFLFCLVSFSVIAGETKSLSEISNLKSEISYQADVTDISNAKYFPALLNAIQTAQKSIYACLYYISYFPEQKGKTIEILNALIEASKRGVKVEVILDQGYESGEEGDMTNKNVRAYSFLKQSGISVFYDDVKTITHAKYFIIDEMTVILGSFNISESSMSLNRESGVLIQSADMAKSFFAEYSAIPKYTPEPVKDAVSIPIEFIRNHDLAAKMVSRADPTVFDFYLLCQKKSFETKSALIEFTPDEIFNYFYKGRKVNFRGQDAIKKFMSEQVQFYVQKYSFIKSYKRDEEKKTLIIELSGADTAEPESLYISPVYWTDAWDKRLSLRAKFCLLYMLDKTSSGRMGRYFQQDRYSAVKEYGISHSTISDGTTELQRFNLIEKDINFRIGGKEPNGYILNDFYVYEDFQKSLADLQSQTDPDLFQTVSGLVDSVNEVSDLEVFKRFIALGRQYGLAPLKQVLSLCQSHTNGISPYRQFAYVEQAIINAGEGK